MRTRVFKDRAGISSASACKPRPLVPALRPRGTRSRVLTQTRSMEKVALGICSAAAAVAIKSVIDRYASSATDKKMEEVKTKVYGMDKDMTVEFAVNKLTMQGLDREVKEMKAVVQSLDIDVKELKTAFMSFCMDWKAANGTAKP